MIIYSRKEKAIVIPDCGCLSVSGSGHSECEREIQIAYNSGWTGGYEQGLEDCSGTTCELQEGSFALRETFSGSETIHPDLNHNGFSQFTVFDNGYGQEKWYEGYTSGSTGCEQAIEEAYNSGYQSGTTRQKSLLASTAFTQNGEYTRDNGWSAVTVNVPNAANLEDRVRQLTNADGDTIHIRPSIGYDGMSQVTLIDVSYGQSKYQSGYTAGLQACSGGCHLVPDVWSINAGWGGGRTTFYPPSTADGFSEFTVYDNGYGRNQYNNGVNAGWASGFTSGFTAGYDDGYQSGHTDGFDTGYQSGYTDGRQTDCRMQAKSITLDRQYITIEPDFGYAGLSEVWINGANLYNVGYDAGSGYGYSVGYQSGYTEGYTNGYGNGYQSGFTKGYTSGYTGGYSDGYLSGISSTDCSEAAAEAYELGHQSGYTDGWNSGYTSGYTNGRAGAYKEGEQSVIKSFLAGNDIGVSYLGSIGYDDIGFVIAYYYTPSDQMCVITGYDQDCDERWDDAFSSMSVDGGDWENPQLYYYLTEGWHQIRFNVKDPALHYAFNHNFTPSGTCYMDALKAISLPEASEHQSGVTTPIGTFKLNNGIRIISSSLKTYGGEYNGNAISGATNLNIIISHYQGNETVDIRSDVQNGILFYPQGKASTHSSTLTGWTHMELF